MEIKVNETPVRTSRNFRINNIIIDDINIPTKLDKFKNVTIECKNAKVTDKIENKEKLTYGNGEILEDNVDNYSNNIIRIETTKSEDIKIEYNFDDESLNLINNVEIIANHDTSITIVYKSNTEKECFHNGKIRLVSSEGIKVNIAIVNMLNNKSYNFEAIENTIYSNSSVKYVIVDLGGKYSISNYYSNILGENAKNDLKSIYLGIDNQVKDINYIAHLRGQKTDVNIDVQGALKDNAKKNFKGTIDFKRGCKKAKGDENEFCMLLSPNAKSIALPMLLCTESDVEGNHSTASGRVDNKALFYIMSRGLSEKEAIKLIVRARFNKIIEKIKDEDTKLQVIKEIDSKLDK